MPLNCSAEKYFNVFTGSRLRTKNLRPIIDFVPFGYDLDKLEMRLYEGYQHVEAYVIYEAPLTQTGQTKPFYFEALYRDLSIGVSLLRSLHSRLSIKLSLLEALY